MSKKERTELIAKLNAMKETIYLLEMQYDKVYEHLEETDDNQNFIRENARLRFSVEDVIKDFNSFWLAVLE